MLGKNAREERLPRIGRIDRDVAGWIIRTDETEVERERKKTQTGQPVAMDQNLPLTFIHIDDMMTYLAQTFAPNRGMFYQIAKPENVDVASQLVSLMRSEEHTSELQSLMRISYAVFCLKKKTTN